MKTYDNEHDIVNPLELSQAYLEAVRNDEPTAAIRDELATCPTGVLRGALATDTQKHVFWINIYNATVRERLRNSSYELDDRARFFSLPAITISGYKLSLNTIEHGILRRNRPSAGFGYLRLPTISRFKRAMQPKRVDKRVHFLLNCGAESCPRIRVLDERNYAAEADQATREYLREHVRYNMADGAVHVPRIFRWYIGDFDGENGVLSFLRTYDIIPTNASPTITYRPYDWTVDEAPFQ